MSKRIMIVIIGGLIVGFVGSFLFQDTLPEIEPKFNDEEFIENLSNYE